MTKIKNPNGECAKGIWRKLDEFQRRVWVAMWERTADQAFFLHPKTKRLPPAQWATVRHNMACEAAWALADLGE